MEAGLEPWMMAVFAVMLVVGVGVRLTLQGSGKTYADELRRELARHELRLVRVRIPSPLEILRASPFPKVEVRVGGTTEVNGVRGEYSHQRVCEVTDGEGTREIWAQLTFEGFRVVGIALRPDPAAAREG